MSSNFGTLYRITTFGESHGGAVGVVIDGCPAGHTISLEKIQLQLDRRRPGQSHLSSPRQELDQLICLSGLEDNQTLGSPICLLVYNKDHNPSHYKDINDVYRPSHADFTYQMKYGIRSKSGGGRASARETIGRVAAAAVAEQIIEHYMPSFKCVAYVDSVKDIESPCIDQSKLTRELVDQTPMRSPDVETRKKMEAIIVEAKKTGDSVGGHITCVLSGVMAGLGEPIFDKLQADFAKALMSLPATRSFEVGLGQKSTLLFGSQHNDEFAMKDGKTVPLTNKSGGIQGGISNGAPIILRVGFKPVATIFKEQQTTTTTGEQVSFKPKAGRHDPCVLPRAVPMVEAMASLVVIDHLFRHRSRKNS